MHLFNVFGTILWESLKSLMKKKIEIKKIEVIEDKYNQINLLIIERTLRSVEGKENDHFHPSNIRFCSKSYITKYIKLVMCLLKCTYAYIFVVNCS